MKVSEGALFCFDDSIADIRVSVRWWERSAKKWSLQWNDGIWTKAHKIPKGQVGAVAGRGCSSGGMFTFWRYRGYISGSFGFDTEVHITCLPGFPICNFDVTARRVEDFMSISGALECACRVEHTELRDVLWE